MNAIANAWHDSSFGRGYASLAPRERRLVAIAGIVLAVGLVWFLVWQPIQTWHDESKARFQSETSQLTYLQTNQARFAKSQGNGGPDGQRGSGSLLSLVERAARSNGLVLSQFKPDNKGGVRIILEDQSFDALLRLVDGLDRQHGVTARQARVDRRDPGLVTANITLD